MDRWGRAPMRSPRSDIPNDSEIVINRLGNETLDSPMLPGMLWCFLLISGIDAEIKAPTTLLALSTLCLTNARRLRYGLHPKNPSEHAQEL